MRISNAPTQRKVIHAPSSDSANLCGGPRNGQKISKYMLSLCQGIRSHGLLGWLRIKSACEEPIQACQRVLCPDVVEAANLAIPPPARWSGVAGPARERVAPDAVDAAEARRDL